MFIAYALSALTLLAAQDPTPPSSGDTAKPVPIEQELEEEAKPEQARIIPARPKRLPGMGLIRIKPKPAVSGPPVATPATESPVGVTADKEEKQPGDAKQDGPRSPFGGGKSPFGAKKEDPFAHLKPGVIPEGTNPVASQFWRALVAASKDEATASATTTGPISSFDLRFQIEIRDADGSNNEAESRVRYLAPNFVRFQLEEGIELGCGPVGKDAFGYWSLNNGKDFQDISMRQYAQSKQRVLDVRNTAKNFLALAEPENLRILSLSSVSEPPLNQPPKFSKHLKTLNWLVLDSPDFDLGAGSSVTADLGPRIYRAYLGLGRTSNQVTEAMVVQLKDGAPMVETAVWITLGDHTGLGGVSFPGSILIRRPDFRPSPWAFTKRPTDEFYLMGGTLRAKLTAEDFRGK